MRRAAFTLVETLVVVAIVMILASMLFALTGAATGRAKHAVCASNLKQLGSAMHLYAQDYDGYLPAATTDERAFVGSRMVEERELRESPRALRESLHPYVANDDVWFCGADRFARKDVKWLGQRHFLTSYVYLPRGARELTWPPMRPIGLFSDSEDWTERPILLSDAVGTIETLPSDMTHEIAVPDTNTGVHSNHPDQMANVLRDDLSLSRITAQAAFDGLFPRR